MQTHSIEPAWRPSDALGIFASTLCVVHCVGTPILLSYSALLVRYLPGEEATHQALVAAVAVFGFAALVRGYRVHQRRQVPAMMLAGFACLFTGAVFGEELPAYLPEIAVTVVGSALMIASHVTNHMLCRACLTPVRCLSPLTSAATETR